MILLTSLRLGDLLTAYNGVTTNYYYQGSMLYAEETNSEIIVYFYDQNGAPVGFQYRGADYANGVWDLYAYEQNILRYI